MQDNHRFSVSGTQYNVNKRYTLIKPIGTGAYGVVISAQNTQTGEKVAIKKVPKAFEDIVDGKRILREVKLLRHFDHENVIAIRDIEPPPGTVRDYEDVYIVTDLMETDLHRIIYSKQSLSDDHIQYFVYQILRGLKYIHSANVLHRDLKPSNLLLNSNCDLKICDFGLARGVDDEAVELTEYVVTRWYRAPEIMLSCPEYTGAMDLWAVGCILAELLGRKPLFPGEDYIHQLTLIMETLGKPREQDLDFVTSEKARRFCTNQPEKPKKDWKVIFPTANPDALDLLSKLLVFHPGKRCTVEEALAHPYLESLHDEVDEPTAAEPFNFEFEQHGELDAPQLRELIAAESLHFHPTQRARLGL